MSSNNSADFRTSSERSLESDSSTGNFSRDCTTQSTEPCFPTIDEIKKLRSDDDSVEKKYEDIKNIGEGAFGAVYKVKHKFDRNFYAIKIIPLQSDYGNEILPSEIIILSILKHVNIVRYHTSCKLKNDDDIFEKNYFCIQMEYCDKTLKTFIDNFISTQENQRLNNLKQILEGLKHIHEKDVMHRDLNPKNIFLTHSGIIKIGDFGSARQTNVLCSNQSDDKFGSKSLTKYIGTKIYCAPELESGIYDKRIDLYSLGIIIFEMFHFQPNTADHQKAPIFSDIRSPEVKMPEEPLEPEIRDVVTGLLEHNPEYRMSLTVAADKVQQLNQFSTKMPTVEYKILNTTEVGENQQMNASVGTVLDTEPSGYKMIREKNVETISNGYAVRPQGDNGWSGYAVGPQGYNGWSGYAVGPQVYNGWSGYAVGPQVYNGWSGYAVGPEVYNGWSGYAVGPQRNNGWSGYAVGPQGNNGWSGYAVGPQGDNGWSNRGRGINCVQDSHSEKSEKIRITKEAIAIFTGKPPKDEVHISDLIEAIETFPHPNVDSNEVPEPSTEDVGNMTEYMRTTKPTAVVKSNSLEDDDSAKCKDEQQREVAESRSTLEVMHATGHLPYPGQTQTGSQQTTAQFHQQDVAELASTSETEQHSSTVFSTVQKVPQSALTDTETVEMDK